MTDQLKRAISAAQTAQLTDGQAEATRIASSSAGDQTFDMSESSYKTSHTAVRKARRFAMQGLYEWLVTDHRFDLNGKLGWKANAPHDIAARTRATNAMHTVHIGYYHEMMQDIPEQIDALDALISQHLDREIDKLDTVEHAILLIGAYELQNRLEIPYKVVLDEAMKLNNHFGATDAHKLINAVLDKMAVELRVLEVDADSKANLRTSQKPVAKPAASTENNAATEANADEKPTASTKPRISANNANVKRNRPNKTGTKKVVADTLEVAAIVNTVSAASSAVEDNSNDKASTLEGNGLESSSLENSSLDSNTVDNNVADASNVANDTSVADIGLSESNIVSIDSKEAELNSAEPATADHKDELKADVDSIKIADDAVTNENVASQVIDDSAVHESTVKANVVADDSVSPDAKNND